MNAMFVNKVLGASLAAILGFIVINKFAGFLMAPDVPEPEHFAYKLEAEASAPKKDVKPVPFPSPAWLAARDATKGAKVFKKCQSCHDASNAKKDGTGPHLWGVVGRAKGSVAGFSYSEGMKAKGGNWTYADLDAFLTKPKNFVAGTKMGFNGLKKETDRAAIIEFLRTQSDAPLAPLAPLEASAPTTEAVGSEAQAEQGAEPESPPKTETETTETEKTDGGH